MVSVVIARHEPAPLADPGMRRSLLPGNREISIAVPTSRGPGPRREGRRP